MVDILTNEIKKEEPINNVGTPTVAGYQSYVPSSNGSLESTAGGAAAGTVDTTETTITNGNLAAETTLFSSTISGGTIASGKGLNGKVFISSFDLGVADTLIFRLKYGSSTLGTITLDLPSAGTIWEGLLTFSLLGDNSSNAQKAYMMAHFTNSGATADQVSEYNSDSAITITKIEVTDYGTATVDSSTDQTLAVTAQYSATSAANDLVAEFMIIEPI